MYNCIYQNKPKNSAYFAKVI